MESHSDAVECEPLDLSGRRQYTVAMLTIYREAALANFVEAEELVLRAMDLRDAGHAILERAALLAYAHALDADQPEPEEEPNW